MPEQRLFVPEPDEREELRLWAEAIADLHEVVGRIAENAEFLIPGEHVDGFRAAWEQSKNSFATVVDALNPAPPDAPPIGKISHDQLKNAQLDGAPGALKRSILTRFRDAFLGLFVSKPYTDERLRLAADASARYADAGAVVLDSIGACVQAFLPPVAGACKAGEEALLGLKQLLESRRQQGY